MSAAGGTASIVNLHAVLYVSIATHSLTMAEIDHLLERARARNLEHDITGVLLYSGDNFMQYIEGPPAGMEVVYGVIKADPLHHGLIEVLHQAVPRRQFAEWSMAFRTPNTFELADPWLRDTLLDERVATLSRKSVPAAVVLSMFWHRDTSAGRF
jgi:hypothetical protein